MSGNPKVFFDIAMDGKAAGRIEFEVCVTIHLCGCCVGSCVGAVVCNQCACHPMEFLSLLLSILIF
jgi:hypothetical protein